MQPTIRIMMATYNGERFIQEQVDSIINQTYSNWSLVIQDDDSNDSTWSILKKYDDERITIKKSPEKHHGAYYNFHSIANQEKQSGILYDYYMFCDQDDIWDEDKIERMLGALGESERSIERNDDDLSAKITPVFCYADMRIINEYGIEQIGSICNSQGLKYVNSESLFFSHIIYGCNTIMNKTAFFAVPIIDLEQKWVDTLSHDNLYAKFSGVLGKVVYYPETTMGYRRHGGNVTSKHKYGFGMRRIIKRVMNIQELARDHVRTYNQSLVALNLLVSSGCHDEKLEKIRFAIKSGGFKALSIVQSMKVDWGNKTKNVSHKLILFLKIYKKYIME